MSNLVRLDDIHSCERERAKVTQGSIRLLLPRFLYLAHVAELIDVRNHTDSSADLIGWVQRGAGSGRGGRGGGGFLVSTGAAARASNAAAAAVVDGDTSVERSLRATPTGTSTA